jgi:DNA-binding IclR family transcriptional regulator
MNKNKVADPVHQDPPEAEHGEREARQRGIQSVELAVDLLGIFEGAAGPLSLKALGGKMDMPMSSVHRYLVSLRRAGLVQQESLTGLYDLGPMALQLGLASLRRIDYLKVAEVAGRTIAAKTGVTTFVSIWSDKGPVIVRWFHGTQMIITTGSIGTILPTFKSSTGRVFTAFMPEHAVGPLISKDSGYAKSEVLRLLQQVRADGYSYINALVTPGLYAVAAPVKDFQGQAQATVTLLSTDPALGDFPNESLRCLLDETDKASRDNGFTK